MDFREAYLAKHGFRPEISETPHIDLGICVVIPCYNEPHLIRSLQALWNARRPSCAVEIIVMVNSPEYCSTDILERNRATLQEMQGWIKDHENSEFKIRHIIKFNIPLKMAGVGLARKTGMDEAVYRFSKASHRDGIITGFDADSVCDPDYFIEIEKHFLENVKTPGASIYFEHPVNGIEVPEKGYQGIILYELHLRYFIQALRYIGHPHAFHTIGSSFAVRSEAYVKQGGMNKRQAGEDFYFLQKIIALGYFTEINTTRIIPSPRESDRVPFGTGAAIKRWNGENDIRTYHLSAFEPIKQFIEQVNEMYQADTGTIISIVETLPLTLKEYLISNHFIEELKSINTNSASLSAFRNRFFGWFTVFRVIKYLNFYEEKQDNKSDIVVEATNLCHVLGFNEAGEPPTLLAFYRQLDKSGFGINQR
jgi:hypothetical protein